VTGESPLDDAVRAVGHPGRRAMLRLARDEERSASELAAAAKLSPSAASPHLKLLREAGLMHVRVDAKRRLYRADLARLAEVKAALDELWGDRLAALKARAEAEPMSRRRRGRSA
jgi:DNA-binding transcriptional ArsR family regulator